MKIVLSILFLFSIHTTNAQLQIPISFSWNGLHQLLVQYERNPNKSNTMKVYNYLSFYTPSNKRTDTLGLHNTFESAWAQLGTIERQVFSGKRFAVKLCFKLFIIADGAFAEDLDIILTKLIKTNPRLFLQELKVHRQLFGRGLIFQNFGPEFVDVEDEVRKKEINVHVRALKSIEDSALMEVRDEMIQAYKD
jgi:hypothetical protein